MSAVVRRLASLTLGLLLVSGAMAVYLLFLGSWSVPPVQTAFVSVDIQTAWLDWVHLLQVMVVTAATTALGLVFLWASVARKRKNRDIVLSENEKDHQKTTISTGAACNLVAHAAESVPGVHRCESSARMKKAGSRVDADLVIHPNAELPSIVPPVQEAIRAALEKATGRPVAEVTVRSSYDDAAASALREH